MELGRSLIKSFKEILNTALISLAIFLFVYIFLVQPHRVKGDSMLPNFSDGELLLTEKVSYRFFKPARGDVVVFRSPTNKNADFIKRIIGLPGETITVENGSTYITGKKLDENYIHSPTEGGVISKTLEADEYFVLGDNRRASFDSRSFGSIKKNSIRGKAWLVYWPIFKNERVSGIRLIWRVNYGIADSF